MHRDQHHRSTWQQMNKPSNLSSVSVSTAPAPMNSVMDRNKQHQGLFQVDVIPTNLGKGASERTEQRLNYEQDSNLIQNCEMSRGMTLTSDPVKDGVGDGDSLQHIMDEAVKQHILNGLYPHLQKIVLERAERLQSRLDSEYLRSQSSHHGTEIYIRHSGSQMDIKFASLQARFEDAMKKNAELELENKHLRKEVTRLRKVIGRGEVKSAGELNSRSEMVQAAFMGARKMADPRQTESVGHAEQNKSLTGIMLGQGSRGTNPPGGFGDYMESPSSTEPNHVCREREAAIRTQSLPFSSSGYSSLTSDSNHHRVASEGGIRPYARALSSDDGFDRRVPLHGPPMRFLSQDKAPQSHGGEVFHTSHPLQPLNTQDVRRVPEPNLNPEDVAIFLADKIPDGDMYKSLLRSMGLNGVDISDIDGRHPHDPKERRIEGIKTAFTRARDRKSALLRALLKTGQRYVAEQFCKEFKLDPVILQDLQPKEQRPRVMEPMIPAPKPKNDFERVLLEHLKDPHSVNQLTDVMSKEQKLSQNDQPRFRTAFHLWTRDHRTTYQKALVNSSLLCVMNAWAAVVLADPTHQGRIPAIQIEHLLRACRGIGRTDFVQKLKQYLHTGVSGPTLTRDVYLREIGNKLKRDLVQQLDLKREDGNDWQALAEKMGYNQQIPHWQTNQRLSPASHLWEAWSGKNATIGQLYDWTLAATRLDITAIMEREV